MYSTISTIIKSLVVSIAAFVFISYFGFSVTWSAETTKPNTQSAKTNITWEEVSKSENFVLYAKYLEQNKKTEHFNELRGLVDSYLRKLVIREEKQGKAIKRNVKIIPKSGRAQGIFYGATVYLYGGKMPLGSMEWYSDPTDVICVKLGDQIEYVKGRGIAIGSNEVYVFGF